MYVCSTNSCLYVFLECAVPNPPENLTLLDVDGFSVSLQWTPAMLPNGVLQFYEVQVVQQDNCTCDVGNETLPRITFTVSATSTNAALDGLEPNASYCISVRGYTVGFGNFSAPLSVQTPTGQYSYVHGYMYATRSCIFSTIVHVVVCLYILLMCPVLLRITWLIPPAMKLQYVQYVCICACMYLHWQNVHGRYIWHRLYVLCTYVCVLGIPAYIRIYQVHSISLYYVHMYLLSWDLY